MSRLESLEAVADAAAESDDVRFTVEQENESLQQQLAAAALREQALTTQLQVSDNSHTYTYSDNNRSDDSKYSMTGFY